MHIKKGSAIYLVGNVDSRDGRTSLIAENVGPLAEAWERLTTSVHLRIRQVVPDEEFLKQLKDSLAQHKGRISFFLHLVTEQEGEVVIDLGEKLCVKPAKSLVEELEGIVDVEELEFKQEA